MSIWNTIKADTIGVWYRARTGTVDPWTYQNLKDEAAAELTKAAGPNADPVVLAANIAQTQSLMDNTLATMPGGSALPGACDLRVPFFGCVAGEDSGQGLKKLNLAVDILLGVVLFVIVYAVLKRFGLWGDLVKAFKQ